MKINLCLFKYFNRSRLFSLIVFFILVSFAGCVTTKVAYVENDKLPKEKTYSIAQVFMKDGRVLTLRDSEAKFKAKYKGIDNVITYYDNDYNTKFIELKDIQKLKIEISESNQLAMGLVIGGGIVLALVAWFFIAIANADSMVD